MHPHIGAAPHVHLSRLETRTSLRPRLGQERKEHNRPLQTLCGTKTPSTAKNTTSNPLKHLEKVHDNVKLVEKCNVPDDFHTDLPVVNQVRCGVFRGGKHPPSHTKPTTDGHAPPTPDRVKVKTMSTLPAARSKRRAPLLSVVIRHGSFYFVLFGLEKCKCMHVVAYNLRHKRAQAASRN